MKKVVFYTKYSRNGASTRLRTLQFIDAFGSEVGTCDVQALFDEGYLERLYSGKRASVVYVCARYLLRFLHLLARSWRYDHIHIEKELFPYLPPIAEWVLQGKYSVDYDDAVFHNYDRHSSRLVRSIMHDKIAAVMRYSRTTVVGNTYIRDYAVRAGAKAILKIPTVVSELRYQVREHAANPGPVIGWIGTPTTQRFIQELFPVFETLARSFEFSVHVIGARKNWHEDPQFALKLVQWSEDSEVDRLREFDIGVMPLPDRPFERGKSGYKLVQYMALAKPVVASPVGVNLEMVEPDHNGLLASTPEQWLEALSALLTDREKARRMGAAGRAVFERRFSLESQREAFLSLFA